MPQICFHSLVVPSTLASMSTYTYPSSSESEYTGVGTFLKVTCAGVAVSRCGGVEMIMRSSTQTGCYRQASSAPWQRSSLPRMATPLTHADTHTRGMVGQGMAARCPPLLAPRVARARCTHRECLARPEHSSCVVDGGGDVDLFVQGVLGVPTPIPAGVRAQPHCNWAHAAGRATIVVKRCRDCDRAARHHGERRVLDGR